MKYSLEVQGLFSAGLMYVSGYDGGNASEDTGENTYSFTPLAALVNDYSVSYNVDAYPLRKKVTIDSPKTKQPIEAIPIEDIDKMLGDTVGRI